jgi:GDPmannose 4,6-dehydratase
MKRALITGVTGQDGSYLAELLLEKGYEVHGIIRRSTTRVSNIDHLRDRLTLHYGDLSNGTVLANIMDAVRPDELYNLAAQSHVRVSFDDPVYTLDIAALGTSRLLEILRKSHPRCRLYQASTSEMFGLAPPPQSESSIFQPQSPYAIGKTAAFHMVRVYREGYGLFACSGILFNHESPRRGSEFVTRKITRAVARIAAGKQDALMLGNLDAHRDWGYAKEYVEAMWLMLQQDQPDDYVIATGETHSVREFLEIAFAKAGLDYRRYVKFDERFLRPCEPNVLRGDASKARIKLGWQPKTTFEKLVEIMVQFDLKHAVEEEPPPRST